MDRLKRSVEGRREILLFAEPTKDTFRYFAKKFEEAHPNGNYPLDQETYFESFCSVNPRRYVEHAMQRGATIEQFEGQRKLVETHSSI